ncbi:hypothetical protein ETD86_52825 [Nonomuraea turkmeniaca]|uniref:Uncharacterized protein n=1 Tax=Nonomuraea turkmeniaca TaxID=103838 RepID=A0A5S4EV11_9ACTN|nr:hypothetical protein [Nonomuraea turkmeniaca]TMR06377.1 hypothetical protein ETD86_52825 [Nonomuraea turkmeniaca]
MNTIQYGYRSTDGSTTEHHIRRVILWSQAQRAALQAGQQPAVAVYRVVHVIHEDPFSGDCTAEPVTAWAELPTDTAVQFGIYRNSATPVREASQIDLNCLPRLHELTGEGDPHGSSPRDGGHIVYRAVALHPQRGSILFPLAAWTLLYPNL